MTDKELVELLVANQHRYNVYDRRMITDAQYKVETMEAITPWERADLEDLASRL